MSAEEDQLVTVNFTIHIYTNGITLTETEVNSLFQHIGYPLILYDTRNIQIGDEYIMKINSGVVSFTDVDSNEIDPVKLLNKWTGKNKHCYLNGSMIMLDNQILPLIDSICCHLPDHVISWSCRPDTEYYLTEIDSNQMSTAIDVTSFRFGNIINGNRFVSHLNDFLTFKGKRAGLMSNITLRLSHRTQEMVLRFKITYCLTSSPNQRELKHVRCKFIFDFQSISEIITSANYASEFYLKLNYPPQFMIKEGNHWNQWVDSDVISREIIGKCKVLRLRMELDDDEGNAEVADSLLIPLLHSIFRTRTCDIICVSMSNYCIDYTEDVAASNLPFEVKYTLQCIDSLSYTFADDLIVNNNSGAFYSLIENLIESGSTGLVNEALTRLFNSYFYGNPDVFDAFEHFNSLIATIKEEEEEDQGGRKSGKGEGDDNEQDKIQCIKRIILTPMRTIYLPPSSSETKLIFSNVDISQLIKVHLRDDDHSHACTSPYPYLSEGFGESDFSYQIKDPKCKTFFLKQVMGKKLFGENGLIARNSYKYHGSSLTELFMDGIILQARSFNNQCN